MKQECTGLLLKYREMARIVWNLGFSPNTDLRTGDCFTVGDFVGAFDEAMARLYEGMVLLPLGCDDRVQDLNYPGKAVPFKVEVRSPTVECLVDQNLPTDGSHIWRPIGLPVNKGEFEFMAFFDWDQLGQRDFYFVELLIRRLDAKPEMVGRHAIIPVSECSVWSDPRDRSR